MRPSSASSEQNCSDVSFIAVLSVGILLRSEGPLFRRLRSRDFLDRLHFLARRTIHEFTRATLKDTSPSSLRCGHFNSNLSLSPAIITSNLPGSTTGLLSEPMNERSSGPSLKVKLRL